MVIIVRVTLTKKASAVTDNQMPTGCNRAQPDVEYVAGMGDEVGGYDLNQDN